MQTLSSGKIQRVTHRHVAEVSKQTGFPSAATHYLEVPIDLNKELIHNKEATFFVRIEGHEWAKLGIKNGDVLIIDRSISPQKNRLALIVEDGAFAIQRMPDSKENEICVWGIITYVINRTV
ncbi:MAG: S24 family peptidase [Flavobacteriaceae bacterium]